MSEMLRDRRLRIALGLLTTKDWAASADLAGRSALFMSSHSVANALGRLGSLGLAEKRTVQGRKAISQWRLTTAGAEELGR